LLTQVLLVEDKIMSEDIVVTVSPQVVVVEVADPNTLATAADAAQTAADRVQTGLDVVAANDSAVAALASEESATAQAVIATEAAAEAEATVGASSNIQILNWAYIQAFAITSATRNSNDVITTASIVWPNGATGTFTTDTINTTYNAIDAWHATHILNSTTKTVTQATVTRNSNGAVTAQPIITIS